MRNIVIAICVLILLSTSANAQSYEDLVSDFKTDFPESGLSNLLTANQNDTSLKPSVILAYIQVGDCLKTFDWLEELRRVNESEYNEMIGCMYANGDCVEKNLSKALFHLELADSYSAKTDILT